MSEVATVTDVYMYVYMEMIFVHAVRPVYQVYQVDALVILNSTS